MIISPSLFSPFIIIFFKGSPGKFNFGKAARYEITGTEPANVDHGEEAASEDEEESYDGDDADDDEHNCDSANKTNDTRFYDYTYFFFF